MLRPPLGTSTTRSAPKFSQRLSSRGGTSFVGSGNGADDAERVIRCAMNGSAPSPAPSSPVRTRKLRSGLDSPSAKDRFRSHANSPKTPLSRAQRAEIHAETHAHTSLTAAGSTPFRRSNPSRAYPPSSSSASASASASSSSPSPSPYPPPKPASSASGGSNIRQNGAPGIFVDEQVEGDPADAETDAEESPSLKTLAATAKVKLPTMEALFEVFTMYSDECAASKNSGNAGCQAFLELFGPTAALLKARPRIGRDDFTEIKQIAQGSTAELWLSTLKEAPNVPFVIKVMNKARLIQQQVPGGALLNERDLMVEANVVRQANQKKRAAAAAAAAAVASGELPPASPSYSSAVAALPLPTVGFESLSLLRYAFHDAENVYLVTDFYAGGDLCNLLDKYETFSEDMVRIYASQLVVALEAVHSLGYVHRDLEPANIFLDTRGKLHLADFGSAEKLDTRTWSCGRAPAVSNSKLLQTYSGYEYKIEYVAPEVVRSVEYGAGADLWSLGVVMYEMLNGTENGLFDDDTVKVQQQLATIMEKIKYHEQHPTFPEFDVDGSGRFSADVKDLVRKLVCNEGARIGIEEIKSHPFFEGVNWQNVQGAKAPFTPELSSAMDTSLCACESTDVATAPKKAPAADDLKSGTLTHAANLPFAGFQYVCPDIDEEVCVTIDSPKQLRGKARRRLSIDTRSRKSPLRALTATDFAATLDAANSASAVTAPAPVPALTLTAASSLDVAAKAATIAAVAPAIPQEASNATLPRRAAPTRNGDDDADTDDEPPAEAPPPPPPPPASLASNFAGTGNTAVAVVVGGVNHTAGTAAPLTPAAATSTAATSRASALAVISSPSLASSPAVSSVAARFERRSEAAETPLPARGNHKIVLPSSSATTSSSLTKWSMGRTAARNGSSLSLLSSASISTTSTTPAARLAGERVRARGSSDRSLVSSKVATAVAAAGSSTAVVKPLSTKESSSSSSSSSCGGGGGGAVVSTVSNLKKKNADEEEGGGLPRPMRCVRFSDAAVMLDAVTLGDLETVKALLKSGGGGGDGVDVNLRSPTGLSALCRAAIAGKLEVARYLLLQPNCAVNAQCLDGCTALHLAILEEHTEMVQLLLEHGAKSIMNYDGETALDWTDESPELYSMLSKHFGGTDC